MALTLILMMNSKRLSFAQWNYNIDYLSRVFVRIYMGFDVKGAERGKYVCKQITGFPHFHSLE